MASSASEPSCRMSIPSTTSCGRDPETGAVVKYGDVRLADELQFSVYNFEMADVEKSWQHFNLYEAECKGLLEKISANAASLKSGGGAVSEPVAFAEGDESAMAKVLRRPILA